MICISYDITYYQRPHLRTRLCSKQQLLEEENGLVLELRRLDVDLC